MIWFNVCLLMFIPQSLFDTLLRPVIENPNVTSIQFILGEQELLIVVGHVIAVVAAHRVALVRSETASQARRMHSPLVVLMVGYTVLSLWIISRPIATG